MNLIKKEPRTENIHNRLSKETKERWKEYARKAQSNLTTLIEVAVDTYIETYPNEKSNS